MRSKILSFGVALFLGSFSQANVVGTDYQNFNPTSGGLDFVTVHSSQIMKPCLCNLGVFLNYAQNTLTYSEQFYNLNSSIVDLRGQRAKDSLLYADLHAGFGLTKNWDFGFALPFVLSAVNRDPYGVSFFEKTGLTEVRLNTKYRFTGDETGGFAGILSVNFNTITDNPFSGEKAGPTVTVEFAADKQVEDMGFAVNLGYRKRNPGSPIKDGAGNPATPFVPYNDNWIYSGAFSYDVSSLRSKMIIELVGSKAAKEVTQDTARTQESSEVTLGLRKAFGDVVWDYGVGTKVANAQASPDFRAYLGFNMAIGNFCSTEKKPRKSKKLEEAVAESTPPYATVHDHPVSESTQTQLSMPVTAEGLVQYKYKIGPTPKMNCYGPESYSGAIDGHIVIQEDIGEIPDGGITLCAVAKNKEGIWQSYSNPTIVNWTKISDKPAVPALEPEWPVPAPIQSEPTDPDASVEMTPDGKKYELVKLSAEVLFDFNKFNIKPSANKDLAKIAKHLQKKGFSKVIVEGHTDSKGTDEYNEVLSSNRAQAVANYLVQNYGFEGKRFEAIGKGEKLPVATNETDEGRQKNRRVEFKIFREGEEAGDQNTLDQ